MNVFANHNDQQMGAGVVLGLAGSALAVPPTARMLFKCACDMILILERSFRYQGKYVSVKQIEDAAVYYTTAKTTTFAGKEVLLQQHVHDEVDRLIPLHKVSAGTRFSRLKPGLEDIIYKNRFLKTEPEKTDLSTLPNVPEIGGSEVAELDSTATLAELAGTKTQPVELPADDFGIKRQPSALEKEMVSSPSGNGSTAGRSTTNTSTTADDLLSIDERTTISHTRSEQSILRSPANTVSPVSPMTKSDMDRTKSGGSESSLAKSTRKWSSRLGLRKSKTQQD
jgi:hypothetical protein